MAFRCDLEQLRLVISRLGSSCHESSGKTLGLYIGVPEIDRHLAGTGLAVGAVHEISGSGLDEEQGAIGTGFLALWLRHCSPPRPILWVTSHADLYPPGLAGMGLDPDRLVLLNIRKEREIGWALEEGLRCAALGAVVGEMAKIDLTASRRLQIAAEKVGIPCFILRRWPSADLAHRQRARPISAVTRWRIQPMPSIQDQVGDALEIVGKTCWRVDLWRCRNGQTASWIMEVVHGAEPSPIVTTVPVVLADALVDGLQDQARHLPRAGRLASR